MSYSAHSEKPDSLQSPEVAAPDQSNSMPDESLFADHLDLSMLPTMSEVELTPLEVVAPDHSNSMPAEPSFADHLDLSMLPAMSEVEPTSPEAAATNSTTQKNSIPSPTSARSTSTQNNEASSIATPAASSGAAPKEGKSSAFSLKDEPQTLQQPFQRPDEKAHTEKEAADAVNEAVKPDKSRLPTNLPVDFVDLYDVLSMHRDSKFPDLRKRIAEMYLDAQKNLDHRDAKKKLHYQELFEVLLPQARHLLLDPERRIEYDQYLNDYCEDQGHRALAEKVLARDPKISGTASAQEAAAKARIEEEQLTPEQLEERRVSLWKKWEENLASAHDPLAQLKFSMPELQQRAGERKEYMERALIEVHDSDRRRAEEAAMQRQAEKRAAEEAERRAREEQIEAQRQQQYRETVDNLTTTGRLYWGFGMGSAIFVAGFALLFYFDTVFGAPGRTYPLGGPNNFRMMMLFFTVLGCGFAAWNGTKIGAARIKGLVKTPEVARTDAEISAAQIVTERFKHETSSAKEAPDRYEVEVAIREEALQQLRLIRRSTIMAMMKRNLVASWGFGLGVGTFILCSGTIFLIDYVGRRGDSSSSRGTFVLFGLVISILLSFGLSQVGKTLARKQRIERAID